ncbi:helix-turn-helix transcriptional regulator [Roseovarius sp. S1116L3]|uniref:helix-turn-helix transcriptional regulator n=1 Tax=Roseovarius roseus TaxID=3342636 RepID=UPI0037274E1F
MGYQTRSSSSPMPSVSLFDHEQLREIIQQCLVEHTSAQSAEPEPEYLTTREVVAITKFSKAALEAFRAKKNAGPPFYKQGVNVRYRADEVRAWMEAKRFE